MFGLKQFFGPFDGQLLNLIHKLAATIIALERISFRVFIGQYTSLSFQNCLAGIVFGSNHDQLFFLSPGFILY